MVKQDKIEKQIKDSHFGMSTEGTRFALTCNRRLSAVDAFTIMYLSFDYLKVAN
ncbi:hypothetical protein RF679_02815 [Undibacterium cyanobacteriorum]|uniref:Uncharacterized protein n=1 Tax=Undibacterium cyanobacteriorum TaxID=3073561 RepID=A0ABY9RK60_9BURK|nr:hypothetical protein [Undibacterium sp. 20NA77.5]WMW81229.1 hypothetical protein RF679_02815 [Undibacterium sp. 20NA77.5]